MTAPQIDRALGTRITDLKEADTKWHSRMYRSMGIWLILGIVAGVATWFLQKPIDRDEIMFSGVLGLGLSIWFFGCLFTRMLFPKPDIQCPQCGNNWTSSRDYPQNLLTWKCCPGCGMNMSNDARWDEKE